MRGSSNWIFVSDNEDKRKVLISYEDLRDGYKKLIENKYVNVYDYMTLEPIKALIKRDIKALQFFENYNFSNGERLPLKPVNYVELYTRHAELFNMATYVLENKRVLKKELCMTMDTFWETLVTIVKTGDYQYLPQTTDNIKKRWRVYNTNGYQSLISNKFGNVNTAKLTTDEHIPYCLN
jgi:hypothetical protein